MTVLSRLRKRSGFLVTAVGVALLAFVLTGLFESKGSMFSGKQYVGVIGGDKITLENYDRELSQMEAQQMDQMGGGSLDAQAKEMVNNNTWDKIIREMTLNKEIANAGITVSDEELSSMILGKDPDPSVVAAFTDNQTGKVNPNFADEATGQLSGAKIKQYVDKLQESKEGAEYYQKWKKFEQSLRDNRRSTKYYNLVKKGLYVTKSYAKQNYVENSASVKFRYILKRYQPVPDSTIKVTEEEIQKYYNENQKKYKQEASRKIEYIVWDVLPSDSDKSKAITEMRTLADQFKSATDDSAFVSRESDNKMFDATFVKKSALPPGIDTAFFNAEKGSILGPILDPNTNKIKIVKLVNSKMGIDSGSTRHILINYAGASQADPTVKRTRDQAKALADSILKVLKKNTKVFPDLVLKFSSDSGSVRDFDKDTKKKKMKSRDELGAYKWFKEGQMMKSFQDAVWDGKKGDLVVVETPFGFHVMEVLDRSKESRRVQLATVEKTVEPSTETKQMYYDKATDFALKYNTPELFNKGVETEKLNKRIADPIVESEKKIAGLDSPREMIRWSFAHPKGTISGDPFNFGNKYVVAMISEVREKGIAPLEQKHMEVEIGARQEKKAQMFIDEFNKTITGGMTIDALSTRVNLPVEVVDNFTLGSFSIPNLGKENTVAGTIFTLKEGQLSKPIKGLQGVYVVVVDKTTPAPETKDYTATQKQVMQNMTYRVDQDLYNAMKTKADVEDDRAKYY
jgi:peptidyl-prolyl cis-trans isomerase D